MRALLERLEGLYEATYERDRAVRDLALDFYKALVQWGDDEARYYTGSRVFKASKFWKHPLAKDLKVAIRSRAQRGRKYKPGDEPGATMDVLSKTMTLYISDLMKPLGDQIGRGDVVHEFAHFVDPGAYYGGKKKIQSAAYYNKPTEWNAHWQEGAEEFEKAVSDALKGGLYFGLKGVAGDGSWKQFRRKATIYWSTEFLRLLNKKNKRKFEKRLYQLWEALKKKGVWDADG
jgi:hypothetical protein